MMEEEWRDIKGYEGYYQVSSNGRVRSLDKTVYRKNGTTCFCKGRIIKQNDQGAGYLSVHLCKDGLHNTTLVHRIVALNFIPNPDSKLQVNHIDGNKHNNMVSNLEWCTGKENMKHAMNVLGYNPKEIRHVYQPKGEGNANNIKIVQLNLDYTLVKIWCSASEATRQFGFAKNQIETCILTLHGNKVKAITSVGGYRWMYYDDYVKGVRYEESHRKHMKTICQLDPKTNKHISTFRSCTDVQRKLGICRRKVERCLKGKAELAGGYKWIYEFKLLNNEKNNI